MNKQDYKYLLQIVSHQAAAPDLAHARILVDLANKLEAEINKPEPTEAAPVSGE